MAPAPALWFNVPMARRPAKPSSPARTGRARKPPGSAIPTLFEVSAGGVVYRRTGDGIALCLIATKGGTRWQLPKGKQEAGESLAQTAAREVAEETGLVATVGPEVDTIELWFMGTHEGKPVRHHKVVHLFLMAFQSGNTRDHDREVDEARWFPAAEALERMTFPSERRAAARALALLAGDAGDHDRSESGRR